MSRLVKIDKENGTAYIGKKGKWIEIPDSAIEEALNFDGDILEETDEFEIWDLCKEDFDNISKLMESENE